MEFAIVFIIDSYIIHPVESNRSPRKIARRLIFPFLQVWYGISDTLIPRSKRTQFLSDGLQQSQLDMSKCVKTTTQQEQQITNTSNTIINHLSFKNTYISTSWVYTSYMFSTLHRTQPGETTFLETLDGDAQLAPSGGVAPGERQTVGTVSPKRGRLLLSLGCRLSIQQGVEVYIYWFQDFCWCWVFLFFWYRHPILIFDI